MFSIVNIFGVYSFGVSVPLTSTIKSKEDLGYSIVGISCLG